MDTQLLLLLVVVLLVIIGLYWRFFRSDFQRLPTFLIKFTPPQEISLGWKGDFVKSTSIRDPNRTDKIICFDPATGYSLGEEVAMNTKQVHEIVASARKAQVKWAKTTFAQRKQFLQLLNDFVIQEQEALAKIASRDSGKTAVDAAFGEILTTCEKIRWTIANGEDCLKTEYRSVCALMMHKVARVEYRPLGVVAAIVSWNYPFHNMIGPMISALFAGNACVVKVSEFTPWSSKIYESIIHKALVACGHSPDLFRVVTGFAEAGQALLSAPVDKVTFIGSPKVGKMVMAAASETLTPVVLELGGKDAAILCDDCDYGASCNLAMRGTFQSCGQNCIGLERLIVHAAVYDKFVADMSKRINNLTQGPPLEGVYDTGSMVMGHEIDRLETLVEDAVSKGARLLAGGKRKVNKEFPLGQYFAPTLLVDVNPQMRITQEEVFGPIMVIMKSENDEQSIALANSCDYGLGGSVFSKNYARAEYITSQVKTGMANINDFAVNYLCQSLPFGGVKVSGFDRFAGIEGLRGNCLVKAVTSDRFPGVRTNIPPLLNYPITRFGFDFCVNLCTLFYGNLSQSFFAALNLAKLSMKKKKKRPITEE